MLSTFGHLTTGDDKSYQIAEIIHYGMYPGCKTSTVSSDCLMCAGTMPAPRTMLMGVNITSLNNGKFHVGLQSKKFKNSFQLPSFLPSPETETDGFHGPYTFDKARHEAPVRSSQCYDIEKVSDVAGRSSATRRTFCRQYGLKLEPEILGNVAVTHSPSTIHLKS